MMMVDPKRTKIGDIFRIGAGSPAIDAAEMTFDFVTEDGDGRPRNKPDIGAQEVSTAPAKYGC
jgi:hypothetical protein